MFFQSWKYSWSQWSYFWKVNILHQWWGMSVPTSSTVSAQNKNKHICNYDSTLSICCWLHIHVVSDEWSNDNSNNNKQLFFYSCFYSFCSLHMDMSKCLLFVFLLHLSHLHSPVFSIFVYSMKMFKSLFLLPSVTTYSKCLFIFVKKILTGFYLCLCLECFCHISWENENWMGGCFTMCIIITSFIILYTSIRSS